MTHRNVITFSSENRRKHTGLRQFYGWNMEFSNFQLSVCKVRVYIYIYIYIYIYFFFGKKVVGKKFFFFFVI